MSHRQIPICIATLCAVAYGLHAQAAPPVMTQAASHMTTARGRVEIIGATSSGKERHGPIPGTVVWLTPIAPEGAEAPTALPIPSSKLQLVQKNKSFEPHILVVPLGSNVEFPNRDPFFHNVFSLFEGKRFDLGLYEAGTSRMVRFDRPGISYIFCNIHPEMSAVIVTLSTPYYAVSAADGSINLHEIPPGTYEMHVWAEGSSPRDLDALSRRVLVSTFQKDLGTVEVTVDAHFHAHKNKFGEDYQDPSDSLY